MGTGAAPVPFVVGGRGDGAGEWVRGTSLGAMARPDLDALLHAAVQGVGGVERPGQVQMAHAVEHAIEADEHLLVQAGTGTGKSLAYLIPAVAHAFDKSKPAVVATATLTLQAQIVDRDMPRLAEAIAPILGRKPTYALVKGRRNYLCQHKLVGGFPEDEEEGLLSVGQVDANLSRLGAEVVRLREWAEVTQSGDRDELVPGVSERAWRQVSVSAHECLGSKCPVVTECFVEQAREAAREVDVVVTNHSFMAIDSFEGRQMLPEHDLLIVDEAHELVDRVTSTVTDELTASMIAAAAKRAGRLAQTEPVTEASVLFQGVLDDLPEGRLMGLPDTLALALTRVRDTARAVQTELKPASGQGADTGTDGARQVARAAIDEIHENAERILEGRELDVVWVSRDPRRGSVLRVAPMSVAMLLRDKVFGDRTVVMTSATLELGGTFDAVAGTLGLRGEGSPDWQGLDVGSPFDYPKQAIAYVAKHLPAPGRDGIADATLDEIEALIRASGGRALGLFSSMRAAVAATEAMRERFGDEIAFLCQGEDQTATLVRQFAREPSTCLFGTLSLWQGVDVPGSSCQLVIIDRIPFPRPDDPLASARSQAIARMGGNGFMAVSATHAALRLAQGAGRLVRRGDDRGVVAFLDSRMMTARYAGFLQRSLPPFWPTTDRAMVLSALKRLDETAPPPLPVHEPALRGMAGAVEGTSMAQTSRPVATAPPVAPSPRTAVTQGRAWSSEEDEELRDGVDAGLDLAELADHFECEPEVVAARLSLLGLELSDAPRMSFD